MPHHMFANKRVTFIKTLHLNANTSTKNKSQNNNINYFLLDQWHINDIMALTYGAQQLNFEIESLKVTFTWDWQKTQKNKEEICKSIRKVNMNQTRRQREFG